MTDNAAKPGSLGETAGDPSAGSTPAGMRTLAVIPARLASTRLPRKVLREIAGEPMLAWVYAAARACPLLHEVVVAIDSPEVQALCEARGWPYRMTSPNLLSGSDRLFAVAREMDADIYVNVQADEPLLTPAHFQALLDPFDDAGVRVSTLRVPCPPESIHDPNVVKVVSRATAEALYFSRAAIPYERDPATQPLQTEPLYWKHLGLYAYRKEALAQFAALRPSRLETMEKLEQLRLLENGIPIHVASIEQDTLGVDTEDDLLRVQELIRTRGTPLEIARSRA